MASGDRFDEDHLRGLVQAIRDGNAVQRGEAVTDLLDEIDGWLLALFYKAGVDNQDFKDLQHSTVVKILQSAHGYRDGSAVSWIKHIAFSVVGEHNRKFKANAPAPLPESEQPAPPEVAVPLVWDAWQRTGMSTGRDVDQWSEGQRRLALEACVEFHLKEFENDDPPRGAAVRKASLEDWSMKQLGEYLGKNANNTRVYARESRLKSASYFEECMQFVQGLVDRKGRLAPREGRA